MSYGQYGTSREDVHRIGCCPCECREGEGENCPVIKKEVQAEYGWNCCFKKEKEEPKSKLDISLAVGQFMHVNSYKLKAEKLKAELEQVEKELEEYNKWLTDGGEIPKIIKDYEQMYLGVKSNEQS